MVFSGSKMLGHGGSRFGWALVKDEKIAAAMRSFIFFGPSIDMQMRSMALLQTIVNQGANAVEGGFYEFGRKEMDSRWVKIREIFESDDAQTKGYKITNLPLDGPFIYLKCPDGYNCPELLMMVNVTATSGRFTGTSDNFVRAGLVIRTSEYNILTERFAKLVTLPLPTNKKFFLSVHNDTFILKFPTKL